MAWRKTILVLTSFIAMPVTNALAQQSTTRPNESAGLIRKFQAEYPTASMKLEEAYSHVRIVAIDSWNLQQSSYTATVNVEYLREGNLVRGEQLMQALNPSNWMVGSLRVFGGDSKNYFDGIKPAGQTKFKIDEFGPEPNFEIYMRGECLALYAPYLVRDQRLTDYLKQGNRKLISADTTKLDGADAIEIVVDAMIPGLKIYRDHFFFQPNTWALEGWKLECDPQTLGISVFQARVTYESNTDPPKVKRVQNWTESVGQLENAKKQFRKSDIISVEFGPIPASEFTPSAVGIHSHQ